MFRILLFTVGLVVVAAQPGSPCGHIMHLGMKCCKKGGRQMGPPEDLKECFQVMQKPPSCDLDICIAKKKGYASDSGAIDKAALTAVVDKEFASDASMATKIKEQCVNGDVSSYGPADFCELMKLKLCMDVQLISNCGEWDNDGDCAGVQDKAKECIQKFA